MKFRDIFATKPYLNLHVNAATSKMSNHKFSNLIDLLQYRALSQPNQMAFTFLGNGEIEEVTLTYRELDQKARAIAAQLQSLGVTNKCALLLYPPGLDFIAAFFGCMYASVIAVPAYLPRPSQSLGRLQAIVADALATVVLTTTSGLFNIQQQLNHTPDLKGLNWLATDKIVSNWAEKWQEPIIGSESLAFLQYTSGSTSRPKGVMVSHENLLYNIAYIDHGFQHTPDSVAATWLPHFHDMGLIDGLLKPLYKGIPSYVMAPISFIQKPIRWLQVISRYRVTHSGGPNLGYELCVSKFTSEQDNTLDLSSWCVAYNGAEPIRTETLEKFAQTFRPYGFQWNAFCPAYGLAETTLKVSTVQKEDAPIICTVQAAALEENRIVKASEQSQGVRILVGCGRPDFDTKVVIAHPESLTQCSPEKVGEIWVSGPTVAQGYWNRPEETERTFRAYIADTGEGPFLRTGDLGFFQDGELFVTGRLKDLIIIGGRNHYPQDIELLVEKSHPALRPNCGAAFSVEVDGQERLVIAQEVERTYLRNLKVDEIVGSIRQAVSEQQELQVYAVVLLKPGSILKTSSGKIQRQACRAGFLASTLVVVGEWRDKILSKGSNLGNPVNGDRISGSTNTHRESPTAKAIEDWLVSRLAKRLNLAEIEIDTHQAFSYYGLGSVEAVGLAEDLGNWLNRSLAPTLAWDYPSIAALAQYLSGNRIVKDEMAVASPSSAQQFGEEPIAIIGLGCRFPGAKNPEEFWQLLTHGINTVTEVPLERWDNSIFYDANPATPGKLNTFWGSFLEQVDQFDPHFFSISPREAKLMDPQQRLLLEVAWETLENAGQAPNQLARSQTGVFVGISNSDYSRLLLNNPALIDAYVGTGSASSIAANRLSYLLDLRGPSFAVDTACSSSLVAVHLACQSLNNRECNLALVGAVNLILSPELTLAFSQAQMMSASGHCKTFDAEADGYVRGEGCGMVALKRLSDALKDGDQVLALIRGSAVNQDGRSNGLTAPNGLAQQAVIQEALANARIAPAKISYVETHGTGTPLGDPIEIEALKAILMQERFQSQPCALGSVKTNIGHLEAAAGIAGLIKVVLSLQNGEIPPHLHLNQLNPNISLEDTPLFIPKKRQPWPQAVEPRFAGVSSFGFGGTNCHVVLEEAPELTSKVSDIERSLHLLTLSAKSHEALQTLAARYEVFLAADFTGSLADVCFTANTGRAHFAYRLAVTASSHAQLREQLAAFAVGQETDSLQNGQVQNRQQPKVGFLFTGQGSQYIGMGRQLYETQPTFRKALERCDELLRPYLEQSLLSVLYPETGFASPLNETVYTQPALFALEYALAELWRSWGIEPAVVMGHSVGEYVAACIAGVFSLEDGLKLIAERSRLIQALPQDGQMATVFVDAVGVADALAPHAAHVAIAAVNGPNHTVISGRRDIVQTVLDDLSLQGIATKLLKVSHAFHSPLMEPILDAFEQMADKVQFKAPCIPLISNLTGQMLMPEEIPDASYWRHHIRETVQFSGGMKALAQQGCDLLIELGPHPILLGMGKHCLPKDAYTGLPSLKKNQDDLWVLLNSVGALYVKGLDVNWAEFDREYSRSRIPLPTYPFERKRYWLEKTQVRQLEQKSEALPFWESLLMAGWQQAQQGPLDLSLHTQPAKLQCLDSLTTAYVVFALQSLGVYSQEGERHSVETLLSQFKILPIYQKLLAQWLKRLVAEGLLQQHEEMFISPLPLPKTSPDFLWDEARKKTNPHAALDFIRRCGENLANVLVGDVNPIELLFPGGSLEIAEGIYQHAPEARYFNSIIRAVLESIVNILTPGKQLRILEVGAKVGGTTASLLPVLPGNRTLYCYTDPSATFLTQAQQKFAAYPFVHYALLDIEQNPQEQGYESYSFDVVVAANVLHATCNLKETLQHVRSLLAPGGVLLIWEVTHPQAWLDITFELFNHWHRHDDELRQASPFLIPEQWDEVLRSSGFEEVATLPESGSMAEVLQQHVLVARIPLSEAHLEGHVPAGLAKQNGSESRLNGKSSTPHAALQKDVPPLTSNELQAAEPGERQQLLESYLSAQVSQVFRLPVSMLDVQQPLKNLGLDSLMAGELRTRIKASLGVIIPWEDFPTLSVAHLATQVIEQLIAVSSTGSASLLVKKTTLTEAPLEVMDASLLSQNIKTNSVLVPSLQTDSWVVGPVLNPRANLRLFCFPYAGGSAAMFRQWPEHLPPEIEVCPVQLPGRESRTGEQPFTRLSLLVEKLVPALLPYMNIPFAFFGHSMGALICFELARQLRRQKSPRPVHLFVSSRCAPQIPELAPPIHRLPELEFLEELRRFNGTPEEVLQNSELMQLMLPVLRADFAILETYVYATEEPLDCPLSAFGGLQDSQVSVDNLRDWHHQTHSTFNLKMFPGDHFFTRSARKPLLQAISQELKQILRCLITTQRNSMAGDSLRAKVAAHDGF